MRIIKISLTNFKSFKDRTEISLNKNCNVIVGKNGSGKSNLISAIQLVVCCPRINVSERQNMIHEGSLSSDESCVVEVEFDNSSQRFHGPQRFTIKREISVNKDDFYVDGKHASREEVRGMFESAGIPVSSPYFLVLQGKINSLAVMSDEQRFNLIKSVAGVSKYEEDRVKGLEMLEETKHTQNKVEGILERIEDKLGGLEKDKRLLEECEALENEKRRCEVDYTKLEILDLNKAIREIECSAVEKEDCEDSEEVEDLENQLREVRNEIEEALNRKSKIILSMESGEGKLRKIEEKLSSISQQIQKVTQKKKEMAEAYENCFVELQALKMMKGNSSELNFEIPENTKKSKETEVVYDVNSLKKLIEKRNGLWREERILKGELSNIEENLQACGNKMALSGQNISKGIQEEGGSYVIDLFDVPEDLMVAFEAVAGPFLFNVVVKDEKVAARLSQSYKNITFIPLNRMFYHMPMEIEEENLFLLSSQIHFDNKELLGYITKNSYVCSDIKSSNVYSQKYNINVVTLEGDVFSSSGVITGGYEKKKNVLVDYKKWTKAKGRVEEKINEIQNRILEVSCEIDILSQTKERSISNTSVNLKERILTRFNQDNKMPQKKAEKKLEDLCLKLPAIQEEQEELSGMLVGLNERLKKYNTMYLEITENALKKGEVEGLEERVRHLQAKERVIVESLRNKEVVKIHQTEDIEKEMMRTRRHVLYNKRLDLMRKIGVEDYKSLEYPKATKEELLSRLKEIQTGLKKYLMINRRALQQWKTHIDQKDSLKTRLVDLKENLENIKAFISDLDGKKERFLEFTLEMFRTNFKYFSTRLSSLGGLDLLKEDDRLVITSQTTPVDLNLLSGGQKTMIALCLIFSIQKIDPSPFYIFDEADANLDKEAREKITELFKEIVRDEDVQFVISTFKDELVGCGNKFIGVSFSEKKSYAGEVTREVVYEFLNE